jgi:hypothetical protein
MKILIIEDDPSNKIGLMHTVFAVQPRAEIAIATTRDEARAKLSQFHHLVIASYQLFNEEVPPTQPTIWIGDESCPIPCLQKGNWNGIKESIKAVIPTPSKTQNRPTYNVTRKPDGVVVVQQPKKWLKIALSVGTVLITALSSIAGYVYLKGQDDANQANHAKTLNEKISTYETLKLKVDNIENTQNLKYLQYDTKMALFEKVVEEFKTDFKNSLDQLFNRIEKMDTKFDQKIDTLLRRNP